MKLVLIFFSLIITIYSVKAQSEYSYSVVPAQKIQKLKPGNYVFKEGFEYINFRNIGDQDILLEPVFFSEGEFGLILPRTLTSGSNSFRLVSVIETETNIIVNTKIIKSYIGTCDMKDCIIFLKIPKSEKEIIFNEIVEQMSLH
ncbi:MAG: hypothetical protein H0W73_07990 [Bacteroidetes bacterium]|nr:hypothetical protein [Bacteroidota bacterium]